MKKTTTAALAVLGLIATSTAASAQALCVLPLFLSAAIVSAQENRELTQKEAFFCGLVRDEDAQKKAAVKKTTTTKKVTKKTTKKKTTAQ